MMPGDTSRCSCGSGSRGSRGSDYSLQRKSCLQPVLGGLAGFFGNSQERCLRLLQTVLSRSYSQCEKTASTQADKRQTPDLFHASLVS